MANISSIQRELKLKALYEAIEELKMESIGTTNQVSHQKVVDKANQSDYAKQFDCPIGISSVKQAKKASGKQKKDSAFLPIKLEIEKYKEEHKKIVKTTPNKLKAEIDVLNNTIFDLMIKVGIILDREMEKDEAFKNLQKSLAKIKEERDYYFHQVVKGEK